MNNIIKILRNILSSFYNLLIAAEILLVLFFISYIVEIKSILIKHFQNLSDPVKKQYYISIFSNLEYPILFTLIIILAAVLLYKQIKRYISGIKNDKLFVVILIIFSTAVQFVILFSIKTRPIADSKFYIDFGKRLFETGSFIKPDGALTAFWPVGLPAYLSLLMSISKNYLLIAKLVNIVVSALFVLILYELFKNELKPPGRIIFLFIVALFPNGLFSVNCIMADYPFAFLLWLSVYLLLKKDNKLYIIFLTGIILGVMSYLRPVGLLLPVIFAFYFIKYRKDRSYFIKSAVMISAFLFTISPWIVRNYYTFHALVPISTNGGYNFLMGNHRSSDGGVNFNFSYKNNDNEAVASRKAYHTALKMISDNPVESLIRLPEKIFFTYYRGDSSITWALKVTGNKISPVVLSFIFFISNFLFYFVIGISFAAFFLKPPLLTKTKLSFFMFSLYIYFLLIVLVYVGAERYLIPLLPVHFFYTGNYFNKAKTV